MFLWGAIFAVTWLTAHPATGNVPFGLSDGEIQALVDEGVIEDPPAEFKRL